jgi:putative DNA primase/helicase
MRQDFFEFTPRFKIIILGNHKPSLTNVTEGERRRLHIIPLEFVPDEPDHRLADKLKGEAGGILEWMIEGASLWNEQGLGKPKIVSEATNEYFAEQDLFRQWLDDDCRYEPGNTHLFETAGKLFKSWRDYAKDAGEDTETRKSFGDRLRRANLRPYMKRLGRKSQRVWGGIELLQVHGNTWGQSS